MMFDQKAIQERASLFGSVKALLSRERDAANAERQAAFCPDLSSPECYAASLAPYRQTLTQMLGWPLTKPNKALVARVARMPGGRDCTLKAAVAEEGVRGDIGG